ncbi:hypothetical protein PCANC_09116 [Puccinia coronata f. sp. avenae]|uniref:Uncharacterized protein n=1 Tax=Puccinia coronata f. sp. avenae TaxID=200324 RepID=A0A2N5T1F4_9BASI|nr:hypothetical protein PCANC_09116 [Puccinia coronata f. sp. avenae]
MTICAPVEVSTQTPCRATTRPSDDKARLLSGCRRFDGTMSSRTPCRATTRPSDDQAQWLSGCPRFDGTGVLTSQSPRQNIVRLIQCGIWMSQPKGRQDAGCFAGG